MADYPVAIAKEQLSRLIDEALRGECVTIIRHGKPVVELRPSLAAHAPSPLTRADMDWLRRRRAARPPLGDATAILRQMRDSGR